MRPRVSHIILVAAALAALIILGAHATTPVLYTAENTSTAAHADPETVLKRSPGNAAALIPLMDELLGQTGTLALTIKVKDYESAERDLARYTELSGQFSNLVVKLDVSETDIGEFQQKTRANQESLTALLNDSRRFDELQRLEIEVEDDDGQRMAIAYEGEALRQKMQKTFSAYREREPAVTRIAQNYDVNTTPYRESVEHFAEVADAADDWREKTGGDTPLSPLSIGLTPTEGYYGDEIWIAGTCADALPGTPVEIYVDSRLAGNATLDSEGWYAYPYRVGRLLAGPHLVYATADNLYSGVRTFTALPGNTTLTLALAEVNRTTVACTGTLKTGDRAVTDAPVLLRVDTTTLIGTGTDNNGTYASKRSPSRQENTPSRPSSTAQATPSTTRRARPGRSAPGANSPPCSPSSPHSQPSSAPGGTSGGGTRGRSRRGHRRRPSGRRNHWWRRERSRRSRSVTSRPGRQPPSSSARSGPGSASRRQRPRGTAPASPPTTPRSSSATS
jgi:hypothetical protein